MHGEKIWYLEPPPKSYYSTTQVFKALRRDDLSLSTYKCIQEAGDVLYVSDKINYE